MPSTNTAGNPFLTRAYELKNPDEARTLYDEWAATYNDELTGPAQDYVAPGVVTETVLQVEGNIKGDIFDAGCGTGLCGVSLAKAGATTIDGVDLSPEMLKVAEKSGAYRNLATADLSKAIDKPDAAYDVVTCVGTLTHGHVGPVPALREFVRVAKKGGVIVATVLDDIWTSGGYEAEANKLKDENLVDILGAENRDYRKGAGVNARVLVMRKR